MKQVLTKQELIDRLIYSIEEMIHQGDYTVLDEILQNVPHSVLCNSLPDPVPVRVIVSYDIAFDVGESNVTGLPEQIEMFLDPDLDYETAAELVSDKISEVTDFCHNGFVCTPPLYEVFHS